MGKSLSQTIAELYKPKSKEEQDFVDKHVVDKIPDADGNGDEVFKGTATKKDKSKKNDLSPEEQEKVYEDSELEEKNDKKMKDDPCWDSHEMVGHKMKDGKKVPNCVPSVKEDMINSVMMSVLGKMQEDLDSVTEATMKLDRVNIVQFDDNAKKFAKDYVAANKGDYAQGGPSDKDEKNSEKFYSTYAMKTLKSGYAGSGEFVYTNKKTGETFKVIKSANGKGFHGTDHVIMKLNEDSVEESHLSYGMPYGSMPASGVMADTDDNEEDMDIAADLDAEVLEAMVRSATFKLDYIHSVIENEECDIPNHLKFDIQSMKECVDRVYMEIRHCMNEDVDVSESTELDELSRNKLRDYAAKSGDHADKMNKEINTSKGDARVANIRKNMSTIKKRNAGKDLAFKKLGTGNNSYSPNAKVSASKNEEFDLDEAQEKIADKIKDLSPANQKKAQELAKTEEGMKKLLDFIAKLEDE
jgi:hypothetical protein